MMELAGIETPYRNDSLSVASPLYTGKPRVYLNDHNEPRPLDDIGMREEDFEMLRKKEIDFKYPSPDSSQKEYTSSE